ALRRLRRLGRRGQSVLGGLWRRGLRLGAVGFARRFRGARRLIGLFAARLATGRDEEKSHRKRKNANAIECSNHEWRSLLRNGCLVCATTGPLSLKVRRRAETPNRALTLPEEATSREIRPGHALDLDDPPALTPRPRGTPLWLQPPHTRRWLSGRAPATRSAR